MINTAVALDVNQNIKILNGEDEQRWIGRTLKSLADYKIQFFAISPRSGSRGYHSSVFGLTISPCSWSASFSFYINPFSRAFSFSSMISTTPTIRDCPSTIGLQFSNVGDPFLIVDFQCETETDAVCWREGNRFVDNSSADIVHFWISYYRLVIPSHPSSHHSHSAIKCW